MVVLVVEDEIFVRHLAVHAIEDAGFIAVEAENADGALTELAERSDIAVMFSDIRMPGKLDGLALAAAVSDRWPEVRIVLTSGHVFKGNIHPPGTLPFLPKPYRASELIAELERVSR